MAEDKVEKAAPGVVGRKCECGTEMVYWERPVSGTPVLDRYYACPDCGREVNA